MAGWGDSNWNIRLSMSNLFRNNWQGATQELSSPYYSQVINEYGTSYHQRMNISVTYTLGYGKKVNQNNEIGKQSGVNSAIMK